jgi:hypothetical protein
MRPRSQIQSQVPWHPLRPSCEAAAPGQMELKFIQADPIPLASSISSSTSRLQASAHAPHLSGCTMGLLSARPCTPAPRMKWSRTDGLRTFEYTSSCRGEGAAKTTYSSTSYVSPIGDRTRSLSLTLWREVVVEYIRGTPYDELLGCPGQLQSFLSHILRHDREQPWTNSPLPLASCHSPQLSWTRRLPGTPEWPSRTFSQMLSACQKRPDKQSPPGVISENWQ